MMGLDDVLIATRWGVILLRTILRFWRNKMLKKIEASEKLLNIKSAGMDYSIASKDLPVVAFTIAVEKKIYLRLRPKKILLDLTCDFIPQKTFFWDRSYNIEGVKDSPDIDAPDIEAIDNGNITIKYPCTNVFYNHDYIHVWQLKGRVTFHSKIGPINKEIKIQFQLDKKNEEGLRKGIKRFQQFYVEGGYKSVL